MVLIKINILLNRLQLNKIAATKQNKMNTEYLEMPTELFSEIGKNEKLTREMHFSHSVCNTNAIHQFYCTMYGGKRYKTTTEQKEQATKLYVINKEKAIDNVGRKLVFVGMGCEYAARYEDDVCNHRIRTEIVNPQGKRFFIEVGTWGDELMRIDFVINREEEIYFDEMQKHYYDKIMLRGGFNKVSSEDPLMLKYIKYQSQPYYWYKKDQWNSLKTKYTNENVMKLVNSLFDCNFKEMCVDYCHLTTEDYKSISPLN
jgi:hypothetical protein